MTFVSNETESSATDNLGVPVMCIRLNEPFDEIVALNPGLRIEQNANGEVIFMPPTGGESGSRNSEICMQLALWAKKCGGRTFDSSTLFLLPNGAKRSPDASWVTTERWNALSKEERKGYPPLCPDFVVELRSESDRLAELLDKMQEYLENGIRLGWLIDPLLKTVHIYKPGSLPEIQSAPHSISGQDCLPGFVLELSEIWSLD